MIAEFIHFCIFQIALLLHLCYSIVICVHHVVHQLVGFGLPGRIDPAVSDGADITFVQLPSVSNDSYELIICFIDHGLPDLSLLIRHRLSQTSHGFIRPGCDRL